MGGGFFTPRKQVMFTAVQFSSNKAAVLAQLAMNKKRALTAMGLIAVEKIQKTMENDSGNYFNKIWDTGTLIGSMASKEINLDAIAVGTNTEYGKWVHNGTARMLARPFIKDALTEKGEEIRAEGAEYLKDGFRS